MLFSHVKWFVEQNITFEPAITQAEMLFVTGFVTVGLLLAWVADEVIKKQQPIANVSDALQKFRPWLPTAARFVLALMLIYSSINNYLFVPNLANEGELASSLTSFISVLGVMLLLGLGTRIAAVGLAVVYFMAISIFGIYHMLDHIEILGLSAYLLIEGSGNWSLNSLFMKEKIAPLKLRMHSLRIILVSAGISFAVLAFSEKLADLPLAMTFLGDHSWNFLSAFGVSDRHFVIFIGASELTIGLTLVFGLASRLVVFMLLGILILTAALLGLSEVVGHAFAITVVAAAWLIQDLPLMKSKLK
jgi:uncharacterized membrane protein YphA (DoxX/SURF4 family)